MYICEFKLWSVRRSEAPRDSLHAHKSVPLSLCCAALPLRILHLFLWCVGAVLQHTISSAPYLLTFRFSPPDKARALSAPFEGFKASWSTPMFPPSKGSHREDDYIGLLYRSPCKSSQVLLFSISFLFSLFLLVDLFG